MFDSAFRVFSFYAEFSRDFESLGTAFAYKAAGSGSENEGAGHDYMFQMICSFRTTATSFGKSCNLQKAVARVSGLSFS